MEAVGFPMLNHDNNQATKETTLQPQPQARVEVITPYGAKHLLDCYNDGNRRLRPKRVALYAHQMKTGQWQMTGEPIIIGSRGRVLNGQHRLAAIVEAGVPVPMMVVSGVEDSAFKNIDNGLSRSAADVLRQCGMTDSHNAAAVARLFIAVDAGLNPANTNALQLVTRTDIADWATTNAAELTEALAEGRKMYDDCRGNKTAWAVLWLMLKRKYGHDVTSHFFDSTRMGSNLNLGDTRLALRNWSLKTTVGGKFTTAVILATYIRLARQWMEKKSITVVRPWSSDKPFPTL